jgi:hypothetical protein
MSVNACWAILAAVSAIMAPGVAAAYVGPGAGLGMTSSLIAVVGVVFVAILGLLILPFRVLMKRRKAKVSGPQERPAPTGSSHEG